MASQLAQQVCLGSLAALMSNRESMSAVHSPTRLHQYCAIPAESMSVQQFLAVDLISMPFHRHMSNVEDAQTV